MRLAVSAKGESQPGEGLSFGALLGAALAALASSACCLGPLVLLMLGISGSWISNLAALERYRPIFVGIATLALFFAYRRIFHPIPVCGPNEVCSKPRIRTAHKLAFVIVAALAVIAVAFPYILPLFY